MRALATLPILLACLITGSLASQSGEKPQIATEIESVRLQVENDGENAYFHFTDAVLLKATNMTLECDSLEVFATREAEEQSDIGKFSAIKQIVASGNVRIIQAERTATCQKAVVHPKEQRIVLSGNPVVVMPGGLVQTFNPEDEIILDRGNGRMFINAKPERRLRLTSSAIGDLGFEDQGPVPTAELRAEEEAKKTATEETLPLEEKAETKPATTESKPASQK